MANESAKPATPEPVPAPVPAAAAAAAKPSAPLTFAEKIRSEETWKAW